MKDKYFSPEETRYRLFSVNKVWILYAWIIGCTYYMHELYIRSNV